MEQYYKRQLSQISEIIKHDNVKDAICEVVIKEAQEKNIKIDELLEELPSIIEWNMKDRIYEMKYEMSKPKDIGDFIDVEFVNIHRKLGGLCDSTIILKINGQEIEFNNILCSGGMGVILEDDQMAVGPWSVHNLPKYLEKYEEEITEVINKNVQWGCCGGCI